MFCFCQIHIDELHVNPLSGLLHSCMVFVKNSFELLWPQFPPPPAFPLSHPTSFPYSLMLTHPLCPGFSLLILNQVYLPHNRAGAD